MKVTNERLQELKSILTPTEFYNLDFEVVEESKSLTGDYKIIATGDSRRVIFRGNNLYLLEVGFRTEEDLESFLDKAFNEIN